MFQLLRILAAFGRSFKVLTAVMPVAAFGTTTACLVSTQPEPAPSGTEAVCGTLIFQALWLTILMQAHRLWFEYNPIVNSLCAEHRKLAVGELTAFLFCSTSATALYLALRHRHFGAELLVGVAEIGMLVVLLLPQRKEGRPNRHVATALATETVHGGILCWIMYITSQGPLASDGTFGTLALVVAVLVVNTHYALHVLAVHMGIDGQPKDTPAA